MNRPTKTQRRAIQHANDRNFLTTITTAISARTIWRRFVRMQVPNKWDNTHWIYPVLFSYFLFLFLFFIITLNGPKISYWLNDWLVRRPLASKRFHWVMFALANNHQHYHIYLLFYFIVILLCMSSSHINISNTEYNVYSINMAFCLFNSYFSVRFSYCGFNRCSINSRFNSIAGWKCLNSKRSRMSNAFAAQFWFFYANVCDCRYRLKCKQKIIIFIFDIYILF